MCKCTINININQYIFVCLLFSSLQKRSLTTIYDMQKQNSRSTLFVSLRTVLLAPTKQTWKRRTIIYHIKKLFLQKSQFSRFERITHDDKFSFDGISLAAILCIYVWNCVATRGLHISCDGVSFIMKLDTKIRKWFVYPGNSFMQEREKNRT